METKSQPRYALRPAGQNERRCITRQALGFYHALIVGGLYRVPILARPVESVLIHALKDCVSKHPVLSAVITGEDTEAPHFERPTCMDLRNHLKIWNNPLSATTEGCSSQLSLLKSVLPEFLDRPWENCAEVPPWKLIVVPVLDSQTPHGNRFWFLFSFSHGIGDGISGLAFHRTLLQALRNPSDGFSNTAQMTPPDTPLAPPIELAADLQITYGYLLSPLLGAYLPTWLSNLLGLHASTAPESANMWGQRPWTHDPASFCTALDFAVVDAAALQKLLRACRANGAKLTGALHQIIVRAMSAAEATPPPPTAATSPRVFIATTAINLRRLVPGVTDDDMGVFVSGTYHVFPQPQTEAVSSSSSSRAGFWAAARDVTETLAARAATLVDQPVGLLAYLRRMIPWTKKHIGKPRNSSYGLSNIMVFDGDGDGDGTPAAGEEREGGGREREWSVGDVVFSRPADAVGSLIDVNIVTRRGGNMVVGLSWQKSILGVEDEAGWAAKVCRGIEVLVKEISGLEDAE